MKGNKQCLILPDGILTQRIFKRIIIYLKTLNSSYYCFLLFCNQRETCGLGCFGIFTLSFDFDLSHSNRNLISIVFKHLFIVFSKRNLLKGNCTRVIKIYISSLYLSLSLYLQQRNKQK